MTMNHDSGNGENNGFETSAADQSGEVIIENGDETVADAVELAYATVDHQKLLRERIEAQDPPLRHKVGELVEGIRKSIETKGIFFLKSPTGTGKSLYSLFAGLKFLEQNPERPQFEIQMQPRKDAASGVARAEAAILDVQLGKDVGFSTSEAKEWNKQTKALVVTQGILLRYLMEGRIHKDKVGLLIIDEIHEVSVDYHLTFALLKKLIEKGDAPPILFTSATFDKETFMKYFGVGEENYMELEEVMFPVDVDYVTEKDFEEKQWGETRIRSYLDVTAYQIKKQVESDFEGDILVFLPGGGEIEEVNQRLMELQVKDVDIYPLHGGLSPKERDDAIYGTRKIVSKRKIILATNIVETSQTISGVRIVIDTCRQITSRYDERLGATRKEVSLISQHQADQRKGRAGREAEGRCIRIVPEHIYKKLPRNPESEMSRTNLAELVMRLKQMDLDPFDFDYFEKPDIFKLDKSVKELQWHGALNQGEQLTALGREMAETHLEPRVARMVIEAKKLGCADVALLLAVLMRGDKIFLGPKRKDINEAPGFNTGDKIAYARRMVQERQSEFDRHANGSDLVKLLDLFYQAIEMGVFELAEARKPHKGDPPEIFARWNALDKKRKDFTKWCNDYYLKSESLRHVAKRLMDFARDAKVTIRKNELADSIRALDLEALDQVIFAGFADRLLYKVPGRRFDYDFFADDDSRLVHFHPATISFHEQPPLAITVAPEEKKGKRGELYAQMVHPIKPEHAAKILARYVVSRPISPGYSPQAALQSRVGETKQQLFLVRGFKEVDLQIQVTETQQEKVQKALAKILAQDNRRFAGSFDFQQKNRDVSYALQNFYDRSGGRIEKFDLQNWYEKKIKEYKVSYEEDIMDMELEKEFTLSIDDFISPRLQADINEHYPITLNVAGFALPVRYYYGLTDKVQTFVATIQLSEENVMQLHEQDIPKFGKEYDDLKVKYSIDVDGWNMSDESLETIQSEYEREVLLDQQFKQFVRNQGDQIVPYDDTQFSPPRFEKVQYATDHKGNPLYVYPVVGVKPQDGQNIFFKKYCKNEMDGETTYEAAEDEWRKEKWLQDQRKRRALDLERRRREEDLSKEEFFTLYNTVVERIKEIETNPAKFGFHDKWGLDWLEVLKRDVRTDKETYWSNHGLMGIERLKRTLRDIEKELADQEARGKVSRMSLTALETAVATAPPPKVILAKRSFFFDWTDEPPRIERYDPMTPELQEILQSQLEFLEMVLHDVMNSQKTVKGRERDIEKIKKKAKNISEPLLPLSNKIRTATDARGIRQQINDNLAASKKVAHELAEIVGERTNWIDVYKEIDGIRYEYEMDSGMYLTPDQKRSLEPHFVRVAKDKNVKNLKSVVEELVLEALMS